MNARYVCTIALIAGIGGSAAFSQESSRDLRKPPERILRIRALAFSTDGQRLAGCSGEPKDAGEVVVWDARTRKILWVHRIERGMPAVTFSPDGKTLAVGSFSENCYLFDADTGKLRAKLPGHGEAARSVAFTPDGGTLAVGSYDTTIRLWNWRAGQVTQTLQGQADKVYSLTYLRDGKTLASGGSDGSACLWDAKGKLLHKWDASATPLAFDPKGRWLATAGNDASVTIRSIDDYNRIIAHYDRIFAYQFLVIHPDAKSYAASAGEKVVRIYPIDLAQASPADDKRTRELMDLWDNKDYEVREKASRDLARMGNVTKHLVTKSAKEAVSAEMRIRARELLRTLETPQPLAQLRGHHEYVTCAAFSPDGAILATAGKDGAVLLWNTTDYKLKATIEWPGNER